jgi:two-component system sensor histidine kinase CpxA
MKLFVKIFLWFLAAIALMVGVVTFLTRTFQTEPLFSRWQRTAKVQLSIYGGTSTQIYATQGEPGLRQFLARMGDAETIKEVDLVDSQGHGLTGEVVDLREFVSVAERSRLRKSPEIDVSREDAALGAIPVDLGDGRQYLLLIKWLPPRAPSLFFDSWLGYLRLLGVFLTGIIVCYLLALYLTAPIRKLREATQRLSAGDLQTRVDSRVKRRRDELADLASDFDVMAARIESLITSQQRLNRDISHELRSPLARLNVALEIAKQRSTPESEQILARIELESTRLNEMISRLLILAKLESGAEEVENRPVDLTELVRDVADDADFEAKANGKYVAVSTADPCTVMGSENLLRSAIENVLRNAVRYTADGTAIDVSLTAKNGRAVIKVEDHGGGVPEDELANLFRPFHRVGEDRTRKTGGIGLGLAIAERAIKAHKGSILARNAGDGLVVEISLARRLEK